MAISAHGLAVDGIELRLEEKVRLITIYVIASKWRPACKHTIELIALKVGKPRRRLR